MPCAGGGRGARPWRCSRRRPCAGPRYAVQFALAARCRLLEDLRCVHARLARAAAHARWITPHGLQVASNGRLPRQELARSVSTSLGLYPLRCCPSAACLSVCPWDGRERVPLTTMLAPLSTQRSTALPIQRRVTLCRNIKATAALHTGASKRRSCAMSTRTRRLCYRRTHSVRVLPCTSIPAVLSRRYEALVCNEYATGACPYFHLHNKTACAQMSAAEATHRWDPASS